MAKVCIISQSQPSHNPRVVKEADALTAAGYDVSVIAPRYSRWGSEADSVFRGRDWRLVDAGFFGPMAPRFDRIREKLRREAAKMLVFRGGVRSDYWMHAAWHPATLQLRRTAHQVPADLYIAHYPAALPAAASAARRHGSKYAFDAEDFHLGDPPELADFDDERMLLREIEGKLLPGCSYVSAAAPLIAEAYARNYPIEKPTTILNVFPSAGAPAAWTDRGSAIPGPSIYWVSQTIGPDRGLETAVEAIALSRSRFHLYLRGNPIPDFVARLTELAGRWRDHVHILPMAAPDQMESLAAQFDLGFVGETGHTPNRRIALTNKQFTYMLAGLPTLFSDIPAHRALVDEFGDAGRLFACGDPQSLAAAADFYLQDETRLARARKTAFTLGREGYNWETEQKVFLGKVEEAVGQA